LLPENRDATSDDEKRTAVIVIIDQLLGLHKIGNVAIVIYPPRVVSSACSLRTPSGNQKKIELFAVDIHVKIADET
jgi:hypothetical protein